MEDGLGEMGGDRRFRQPPVPAAPEERRQLEPLRAQLLGPTEISVGERPVPGRAWSRQSARRLLLLLLSTPGHRMARDEVLDALWPDASPDVALNSLYLALRALRLALEPGLDAGRTSTYVDARSGSVALHLPEGSSVDVDRFRVAIAQAGTTDGPEAADALREAVSIYGGEFLADEPYLDWAAAIRERLRREWRRAVLAVADIERAAGRPLAAVAGLEALLASDPTDEAAHRALMQAYWEAGRREDARAQFERVVAALRDDLGTEPSEETRALSVAIEQPPPALAQPAPPSLRPIAPPVPPTPFIGRAADLIAITELLVEQGARLVTILGPGGIGKTRLAVEVARRVRLDASVAFVSLASIRDPSLVVPAIARSLGINEKAGVATSDALRDALYEREVVILLDNFEQVAEASPQIAALLEGNPGLRLVVTSRQPLDLRAEHRYLLAPLSVPRTAATAGTIGRHESVTLFVDRVRAARPGFALTEENASAIAGICARLDGLPLAIELAAVRCRHMSPAELLARLERTLPLLTGGARDLPDRLRTMHDAIAWSYDLLDEPERRLFRRLAVFVGGCAIDDAGQLARTFPDATSESTPTGDLILALADKNLLLMEGEDRPRVRMFETIREFGLEALSANGEQEPARAAHAALFLDLAERAAPQLIGPAQGRWLELLEIEHDNLRAAFDHLVVEPDAGPVLRLCRALSRLWRMHGHITEGRGRAERAIARSSEPSLERARALTTAGDMAEAQSDYERAEACYREALSLSNGSADALGVGEASLGLGAVAIGRAELPVASEWIMQALARFREVGDVRLTASALNYLATIAFRRGQFDEAAPLWQECLEQLTTLGDDRARAIALSNLGVLELERGHPERAAANHEAALAIARRLGDLWGVTHPLINLGRVLVALGRTADAGPVLEEALANTRALGDPTREAITLHIRGLSWLSSGDFAKSASELAQSLQLTRRGDRITAADGLEAAALLLSRRGRADQAARLLGAAEALRTQIGAIRETVDQPAFEETVAAVRAKLGDEQLTRLWEIGLRDDVDGAICGAISALAGEAAPRGSDPALVAGSQSKVL